MTLREKMLAVIADVNGQVAEREELVETIAIALLSRKNLFILGAPGQAKSFAINCFRTRIRGARQFERLLSKQTDEEQLFGRVDLSSLIPGNVPDEVLQNDPAYAQLKAALERALSNFAARPDNAGKAALLEATEKAEAYRKAVAALRPSEPTVRTTGKIPEADICFLDEIFKCNDGVLNSLLAALNERKYTNEGKTHSIPVISFFAASNEIPNFNDPQEKILQALYDRLELKVLTSDIADRAKRLAVLRDKQAGVSGQIAASFTLDELRAMQKEVEAIPVPESVNELADDILCELRKSVGVSDRKYLNYYPIARAKAWLDGHAAVESVDLLALKCYLWQKPADIPVVESALSRMCANPLQAKINDIRMTAQEIRQEMDDSEQAGVSPAKAFRKFRTELLRVYGLCTDLEAKAQTDSEKAMMKSLLGEIEEDSRAAHESHGYTYATMKELAELQ